MFFKNTLKTLYMRRNNTMDVMSQDSNLTAMITLIETDTWHLVSTDMDIGGSLL